MITELVVAILTALGTVTAKRFEKQLKLLLGSKRNEKELYKLKSAYELIQAVLADAEKRQVHEELVRVWIKKIEDVSLDVEDLLLEWITAMEMEAGPTTSTTKVCSLSISPCFGSSRTFLKYCDRDFAMRIKKMNERLSDIAVEKDVYGFNEFSGSECFDRPKTVSFIRASDVVGREVDKKKVIDLMLCGRNQEKGNLNVVSVLAGVGTGKTALAQLIYNCEEVETLFEKWIWVSVAGPFDELRIAKAILEVLEITKHRHNNNYRELEPVMKGIRECVKGLKFLLVLDDVDAVDFLKLEQLCMSLGVGKAGSTILMTTRKGSVAGLMGSTHRLGCLSADDSWTLFAKTAFLDWKREDRERLGVVGKKIVEKYCEGSPLAIKIFGYEMRPKKSLSDWEHVLNCDYSELKAAQQLFPSFNQSYYDLAPNVKRCFSFCASFARDQVIEANNLVQEWMAQGYLTSTDHNVEMEVVGQGYLQHLAMDSFFQVVETDQKNGERIVSVKMHATVHGFAQYLTKGVCSVIEINTGSPGKVASRARHLTVVDRGQDKTGFDNNVPNVEKLSTFRVQSSYDCPSDISQPDRLKPDLIRSLLRVRALDVSRNMMGEIPKEIGNLAKLSYLNFSHNPFWELPETLCDLSNLQSWKLSACPRLRRLPQGIGKLVKLRHLEIDGTDSLMMLPKGIADLASLRTLSKFIVSPANDRSNGACGLAELQNLNKLGGHLRIEGLGNAADAAEAKKAGLRKKIHLSDLEMDFRPLIQNASQDGVIEALEAPHNLQSLQITSYQGTQLPKWMMKLTKLQTLFLQDCQNCTSLPPFGPLPLLAELHLEGMNSVKCLDLGSALPNLKKMKVSKMESWEEWNVISSDGCLPRLRSLKISHCNKLRALPPLLLQKSPLRKLKIDNCPLLHQRYNEETGTHRSDISHNSKFTLS